MAKKKLYPLSTENIMKMGEVYVLIKTDGIDLSCFSENPVMLADHEWDTNGIIGEWQNIEIKDGKLVATPRFSKTKARAIELEGLEGEDLLRAVSIGGEPLECHMEEMEGKEVLVCTKFLALETSFCAIPMNKGCIALYDKNHQRIEKWTFSDFITPITDKNPNTNMSQFKNFALALGMNENATEAEVVAKMSENATAATNLATFQAAQKTNQRTQMVGILDKAVADNRLNATLKDGYLTLSETNFDLVKQTIEGLQTPVRLSDMTRQPVVGVGTAVAGRETWTFSDYEKKDPIGLEKMHTSNPDMFATLYEQCYGVELDADMSKVKAK